MQKTKKILIGEGIKMGRNSQNFQFCQIMSPTTLWVHNCHIQTLSQEFQSHNCKTFGKTFLTL